MLAVFTRLLAAVGEDSVAVFAGISNAGAGLAPHAFERGIRWLGLRRVSGITRCKFDGFVSVYRSARFPAKIVENSRECGKRMASTYGSRGQFEQRG